MKIHLNLVDFYYDISPQEEITDSTYDATKLIPFGKSGIHIKKKNRGSFTSYCGGKVTNACILKGKNSPSAAIRKKATFAANARKWKHRQGGTLQSTLIPFSEKSDISKLFIDYDTPSDYILNNLKDDNVLNDINYLYTSPSTVINESEEESEQSITLDTEEFNPETMVYTGNTSTQPATSEENTKFSSREIPFELATITNESLRSVLPKHMGILGRSGYYDCSNFGTRVLRDLGLNKYGGNCRSLYKLIGVKSTSINDLKGMFNNGEVPVIFYLNTQLGIVPEGLPSHFAIVTNIDRLPEGIILVALGSPGKRTSIKEINFNKGYYKDHFLGIGSVQLPRQKLQFGGILGRVSLPFDWLLYVPTNTTSQKETKVKELPEEDLSWQKVVYNPNLFTLEETTQTKLNLLKRTYSGNRYNSFKLQLELYFQIDPSARRFEKVLTDIAKHESNFNPTILNTAGAPAYGYFLFWLDGKINNITHFSGLSVDEFLNNPQAQISSAVKMARSIVNSFNSQDLKVAQSMGYSMDALIRGAWLGGVGGVRQVLRGLGDPSDAKWYKGKSKGRSVKQVMDEQNNLI